MNVGPAGPSELDRSHCRPPDPVWTGQENGNTVRIHWATSTDRSLQRGLDPGRGGIDHGWISLSLVKYKSARNGDGHGNCSFTRAHELNLARKWSDHEGEIQAHPAHVLEARSIAPSSSSYSPLHCARRGSPTRLSYTPVAPVPSRPVPSRPPSS